MFVIDAYIGNSDRNNGNWGVISRYDGSWELAPVYDNGGCLNNKWDDDKMRMFLSDDNLLHVQAYRGVLCAFTKNEKRINPFKYLKNTKNHTCVETIKEIVPKIKKNKASIYELINDTNILSETQKIFFTTLLDLRLDCALKPIYTACSSLGR